jgi:two-component system chemotaxis response regulator CheY
MTIHALVIDDSGIMRKMVTRALTQTGLADFEFSEAEDGVDGLEKFNPKTTDIVFVDWNMPNMNGIDLVRELRSLNSKRYLPIVMVTTEKVVGKVEEALDEGVDCFISKPFTPEAFEERLGPLIQKIIKSEKDKGGGFFKRLTG